MNFTRFSIKMLIEDEMGSNKLKFENQRELDTPLRFSFVLCLSDNFKT